MSKLRFSGEVDLSAMPFNSIARMAEALAILEALATAGEMVFVRSAATRPVARKRRADAKESRDLFPQEKAVLDALRKRGEESTVAAIAREAGMNASSARASLNELLKFGQVAREQHGRLKYWRLPA